MEANNKAMRDTLVAVKKSIDSLGASSLDCDPTILMASLTLICGRLSARIERALAVPPRNCDVGTEQEQDERFRDFCPKFVGGTCTGCELRDCGISDCSLAWAQMPYTRGATDGSK